VLKLAVKDLSVAGKLTVGVKSGFNDIAAAFVASDNDMILSVAGNDNKGKFTLVKDFNIDSRGNKGQTITESTLYFTKFDSGRENIYVIPKQGKPIIIPRNKLSIKNKNAVGASLTNRNITNVV
jgi:DNA gyrase/topoisomerase IV subunit A